MAVRLDKSDRARTTALEYKGETLPNAPPGPWMSALLDGRYDSGPWIGWCDGWCDDRFMQRWILFVDKAGHCLLWDNRDEDGGVIGKPYAVERPDLIGPPAVGTEGRPDWTPRADSIGAGRVMRFDSASTLRAPEKLPSGFLRADGTLTRPGIFSYRNRDGSERLELRPDEEVFHADSLASFRQMPLTNDHPPGLLTSANAREYTVGNVGENVRRDGSHVAASMMITDAGAVQAVLDGKGQLSCGYSCDYEAKAGVHPTYGRYDGTQRKIRGNHVAIVDQGRAGDARLRLDAADDAAMVSPVHTDTGEKRMKITIKGVETEVPDVAGQLYLAERKDSETALAAASKKADQESARADAAVEAKTLADKARNDAVDPVKLGVRVNERVALVLGARQALGTNIVLDALSDHDLRVKVLGKLAPTVKLDGKSPDYVQARYDIAMEQLDKASPALDNVRRAAELVGADGKVVLDDGDEDIEEKARNGMVKHGQDAHRPAKR